MKSNLRVAYLLLAAVLRFCSGESNTTSQTIDPWQPCASEYSRIAQEYPKSSLSHVLPRCDDQGRFKPLQRSYTNYECLYPDGSPDNIDMYDARGPCSKLWQCLKSKGVKDYKLIRCDKFGYFKLLQKQENGKMICVDVRGNVRMTVNVTRRSCLDSNIASGNLAIFSL